MREAVICAPVRTPVGGFGGIFKEVPVTQLAATVIRALLDRTGLAPTLIDDVVLGQGYPNGEAPALGRVAALDAGLPVEVPGLQVDRRCASGLQAVCDAAMRVQTGVADFVIAGGAESMSQAEFYATDMRWGVRSASVQLVDRLARGRVTAGGHRFPIAGGMLETAEYIRADFNISRQAQDELALRSHERAVAAQQAGRFDEEIVPVVVSGRDGDVEHRRDEHPRADSSLDKLASLRPVRLAQDVGATVTAGNASGQNDGAAVCVVTTPQLAAAHGLQPLATLRGWAAVGVAPDRMGMGPVPATAKVLDRLGLTLADMDLIELNEAFAAQVLGVTHEWGFKDADFDRLNVNGSGISLGHPIGATGARILATMLYEMQRRDVEWGLETMCVGGGQGVAAVFQRA